MGSAANGFARPVVGDVVSLTLPGDIWSNEIPEACASEFSCSITSAVWGWLGIATARRKTLAERTAGSACVNADERFLAICSCTAAVCCFRLAASERFGEITAKYP